MEQNLLMQWEKCLDFMQDTLNNSEENIDSIQLKKSFHLIFSKVKPLSLEGQNLTLSVPADFYKDYIEEHYIRLLAMAIRKHIGRVSLWYSVTGENTFGNDKSVKATPVAPPKTQEVLPKPKKMVNPFVAPGVKKINIEHNLNPALSFDNFVEGESNKFASTVAKTIAKRPGGTAFNPLFIHGGVGVGKTHLAHSIGLEVKNNFPDKIVHYISSEKFIQHFVSAARGKVDRAEFQDFYQMIDVWIIDDIQFLSGKASTQDSFFHIFDYLHQNGKQIVLTSDKAPVDIQDIQDRIVSRFKWGVTAEVKSPDFDTRKKIIVDRLRRDGIELTEDMIDYLAGEVNSNVRELIGVINSVIAYATVYKSDLTLELLKDTINKIASTQKKDINIPFIQEIVCDYFGIERKHLLSKSRKREIALPRQLVMYFAKELTNTTYSKIGEEMGGKDHSTVMYACQTIKNTYEIDKEIQKYVKEISEKIKQYN